MRGVVSCFSPVDIVGVFKPPTVSQLSQQWIIGYISNLSSGDPSKYPVGYEITETGHCQLRNGGFHVTIVGVP